MFKLFLTNKGTLIARYENKIGIPNVPILSECVYIELSILKHQAESQR